jgi:hypothetical protein
METAESRPHRRRRRFFILLLATAVLSAAAGIWLVNWLPGSRSDGSRVSFVGLGEAANVTAGSAIVLDLAPELLAEDVTARHDGIQAEVDQMLFLRREKVILRLQVTAGKEKIVPEQLAYVLRGADGKALSEGRFKAAAPLLPGETGVLEIPNPEALNAARVSVGKLP